ncbi:MAG TPA: ligase-associated DNA damage response endonuclease PdeM [Paracoccaceae bacterium]|nr:ligase-associated DNA damage response endonuclease PdeM [Paracoccaceae bacterium]
MDGYPLTLAGAALLARPSGALLWPAERLLVVADLHLGRSERVARLGGALLPPYETEETLGRLGQEIEALGPEQVVCLGDSFDDVAAGEGLVAADRCQLDALMAGRCWSWIAGNHDPAPPTVGGEHHAALTIGPLTFRHEAQPQASGEISGHWHPKLSLSLRGHGLSRPCFLADAHRIILPAFGAYAGGLNVRHRALRSLMAPEARAITTGPTPLAICLATYLGGTA